MQGCVERKRIHDDDEDDEDIAQLHDCNDDHHHDHVSQSINCLENDMT